MPYDRPGGPGLAQKRPCFFFSYARRDDYDQYVKRFFDDLSRLVAQKGKLRREAGEVSFRDVDDIPPAADWENEIAEALRSSQTLLCLFSTWYFDREYCGKEVQVFLDRQPWVKYEDGVVVGSKRIVPVLWLDQEDLEREGLPPAIVRRIQMIPLEFEARYPQYKNKGLQYILRKTGGRGVYVDILDQLAKLLLDLSKEDFDPLPERPVLSRVRSAFHLTQSGDRKELSQEAQAVGFATDHSDIEVFFASHPARPTGPPPIALILLEAAPSPGASAVPKEVYNLRDLAVRQGFRVEILQLGANRADLVPGAFRAANAGGFVPTILISSQAVRVALPALSRLLEEPLVRGGALILAGDQTGGAVMPMLPGELRGRPSISEGLLIRSAAGGQEATAFLRLIHDLMRRLVQNGEVHRRPRGKGLEIGPTLQGPGRRVSRG